MILLDTNIVSEIMRPQPDSAVINWLNAQMSTDVYLSSITIAEVGYGLYILPEGKRRQQLQSRFDQFVKNAFNHRVLEFNKQAAEKYVVLMGERKLGGRPMSVPDAQIAAIALENAFTLATRNTKDFVECGLELVNPFE